MKPRVRFLTYRNATMVTVLTDIPGSHIQVCLTLVLWSLHFKTRFLVVLNRDIK